MLLARQLWTWPACGVSMGSEPRLYAGKSLDELEQALLAAMLRAASPKGGKVNTGAAQIAAAIIKELRAREQREDEAAAREQQARAARRERPESLTPRNRLLRFLRVYQELVATERGIARVQAQKAMEDTLARIDLLDSGGLAAPALEIEQMRERMARAGMLDEEED